MPKPSAGFYIEQPLDDAIDRFFTHILDSFIRSWYNQVTPDEEFLYHLKSTLRDALCRLVLRAKEIDAWPRIHPVRYHVSVAGPVREIVCF